MATIKKINNDYYVEFYGNGLLFQKNAGPSLDAALAMKEKIETMNAQEGDKLVARNIGFEHFKSALFKVLADELPTVSVRRYEQLIAHFETFLTGYFRRLPREFTMADLTPSVIEEYKNAAKGSNPHKINFTLFLLKDVFAHSINLGYLNDNPCHHTVFLSMPKKSAPRGLSVQVLDRIQQLDNEGEHFILKFMVETGLRLNEVCTLTRDDFNPKEYQIRCLSYESQAGNVIKRTIPLDQQTVFHLQREIGKHSTDHLLMDKHGHPWEPSKLYKLLKKVYVECDTERELSLLDIRDAFAAKLMNRGVPLKTIFKLMGLRDIGCVVRYF